MPMTDAEKAKRKKAYAKKAVKVHKAAAAVEKRNKAAKARRERDKVAKRAPSGSTSNKRKAAPKKKRGR